MGNGAGNEKAETRTMRQVRCVVLPSSCVLSGSARSESVDRLPEPILNVVPPFSLYTCSVNNLTPYVVYGATHSYTLPSCKALQRAPHFVLTTLTGVAYPMHTATLNVDGACDRHRPANSKSDESLTKLPALQ